MTHRRCDLWTVALVIVIGLGVSGCTSSRGVTAENEPAEVQPLKGTSVNEVVLTEDAYRSVGIRTGVVKRDRSAMAATSKLKVIPISALIYDPQGKPWAYTVSAPRTFVRAPIVVARIDGDTVHLSSGPPVGTRVVTVGAAELLGAEYGVGGE